jgi:hypothetical protein
MSISKDDVFKTLITALLSLVVWIGVNVLDNQKDFSCRLRIVELNQARIMERMSIKPVSKDPENAHAMSEYEPP